MPKCTAQQIKGQEQAKEAKGRRATKKLQQREKDRAAAARFTKEKKEATDKKQSSVPLTAVYLVATDQDEEAREKLASEEEPKMPTKGRGQERRQNAGKKEYVFFLHDEMQQDRGAEEHAVEDGFAWQWLQELKGAICCGAARQKLGSG